jgi:peptide alpha-N-acetyltransferase
MGGSLFHGTSLESQSGFSRLTQHQALHPQTSRLLGVVISKLESHSSPSSLPSSPTTLRGYIAMLAVSSSYRGNGIATTLVRQAIDMMIERGADEVVLETEEDNLPAMKLYERLGFVRSKKLHRYYLNGNSAYRLVLHLKGVCDMVEGLSGDRRAV